MATKRVKEEIREALQIRDIQELTKEMREGFKGVHERQDTTNGKVLKASEDIIELKNSRAFYKGGLAMLTAIMLPVLFMFIKIMLER